MIFKSYEVKDLRLLYRAFMDAFSTYQVPFKLDFDSFRIRMQCKLNLNHDLSLLAMEAEDCAGFVLHAVNNYNDKKTAYNGGTGVIPSQRGKQLTYQLYESLLPVFLRHQIDRVLLEVITTNHAAIKVYEQLGFGYLQTYKCYRRPDVNDFYRLPIRGVSIQIVDELDRSKIDSIQDIKPSFIDQPNHIQHNLAYEIILHAQWQNEWAGYCVFQPHLGRISLLGVLPKFRNKGIGTQLLKEAWRLSQKKEITVINVADSYEPMHDFLLTLGFENQVDQYEMELVF